MFKDALDIVLQFEGGFSDDPQDPGGRTNYGITQAVYDPTKIRDVKNITRQEVADIYENQYWNAAFCNKVCEINDSLATILFDSAVNNGPVQAVFLLQGCLNLAKDGVIGPITLDAIKNDIDICKAYLQARYEYYQLITTKHPTLSKFLHSWYSRLNKLAAKYNIIDFHIDY